MRYILNLLQKPKKPEPKEGPIFKLHVHEFFNFFTEIELQNWKRHTKT